MSAQIIEPLKPGDKLIVEGVTLEVLSGQDIKIGVPVEADVKVIRGSDG